MSAALYCLHGFLGAGADWAAALPASARNAAGAPAVHARDWLSDFGVEAGTWDALAARINRWPDDERRRGATASAETVPVVVGYSLGGRAAMHALTAPGAPWRAAIIVSANPGLASAAERERRLTADRGWAERFLTEPWSRVIGDWNAQPVFAGESAPMPRDEAPAARETAALALRRWSVGTQQDLRGPLRELRVPVLWIAGERDGKYVALMRECAALNPRFAYAQVPAAGHRAPWTGGLYFEKVVRDWLDAVPIIAARGTEDAHTT